MEKGGREKEKERRKGKRKRGKGRKKEKSKSKLWNGCQPCLIQDQKDEAGKTQKRNTG